MVMSLSGGGRNSAVDGVDSARLRGVVLTVIGVQITRQNATAPNRQIDLTTRIQKGAEKSVGHRLRRYGMTLENVDRRGPHLSHVIDVELPLT